MRILLADPTPVLEQAFVAAGHEVRVLRPGPGVFHLPGVLRSMDFSPDLFLQQENLGTRVYFGGLESLDCPTLFWAIDSHLNMFWQQWYALLFDAVLTPHLSLFEALPEVRRPKRLHRFSWPGQRREWIPHDQRGRAMSLCARLDRHRPVRVWLADLLRPRGLHVTEGLDMVGMMRLYDDSRVVPNECIANEVNFRLLEGASSGCLVLSPDVGEDQNALLAPDKEFLIYRDGLELLDQTAWAQKRPEAAEAMGRAAMRRVQAEHLPEHRAATVLELAVGLTRNRLTGRAAGLVFWMTLALQIRDRRMDLDPHNHAREGLRLVRDLPPWPELPKPLRPLVSHALAQILGLFAENPGALAEVNLPPGSGVPWPVDEALVFCRDLLADSERAGASFVVSGVVPGAVSSAAPAAGASPAAAAESAFGDVPHPARTLELASAASAFALRQGLFSMALAFWMGYAGREDKSLPRDAATLCLRWASAWERRGVVLASGFGFVAEKGFLPESALHWLMFAQILAPGENRALARRSAELLAGRRGLLALRIGYLADYCLAEPDNWRAQLEYGLACLQACRVEAGLFEVEEARQKAAKEGKDRLFEVMRKR